VLCQQGLQQFPDRPTVLREIHRILTSNGRLWASVWSRLDGSPGMAALVDALGRHVGPQAADNRRAPFALGDANQLRDLLVDGGFHEVRVQTLTKSVDFTSPEAFVNAQLSATPMSTLGTLTEETHRAIERDVRAALRDYLRNDRLIVPMEAHLATARRGD
jgi:SAM-dependent methyltransferase